MSKPKSNVEMQRILDTYLLNNYITTGETIPNLKSKDTIDVLGFEVSKRDMFDNIQSFNTFVQNEPHNQHCKDSMKFKYKVDKAIQSFDFTPYKDMTIEELHTYVVTHNPETSTDIKGVNLIEDDIVRCCVAIYTYDKGSSLIQ